MHPATLAEPPGLDAILTDPAERSRYVHALRKLAMREVSAWRLAQRAKLLHRQEEVRRALRADPRFARVRAPGPERYALQPHARHLAILREAMA